MSETKDVVASLRSRTSRRAVIGGSLAAASLAFTYAALGDKLGIFGGRAGPAPGTDADALKRESVRINHLLRRAGFGVSRDEYDHYQSIGLNAAIDGLVNYGQVDDSEAMDIASQLPLDFQNRGNLTLWWMARMANTRRPLLEKMTLFWHGLLTSQLSVVRDPRLMLRQNEFLRANALAAFPEVLKGISRDPAMMLYLDINGSQKLAPNENYARELMELFSLGIGNYSEQDIREAARAFTGWQVPREPTAGNAISFGEPVFREDRFDAGVKTFLGRQGNFRPDDIVDIIVEHPASAKFIVAKLFSFFVYADPDDKTLQPFVDVYLKDGRSIRATVEAILRSEEMYSPKAYRAIVRSPVEYAVAAIKALGGQAAIAQTLAQGRGAAVAAMGQVLFEPPNVAGWPGGAAWLNSATMFARLNLINQITGGAAGQRAGSASLAEHQRGTNLGTVTQALDYYLPLALDDNVPDESRQVLVDYGGGLDAALSPERLRGLVYLVLASPQFHLA